jgi:hypothetical protein
VKRPIIIERPNDLIPGLLDLNLYLAAKYGVAVALVVDIPKGEGDAPGKWVSLQLRSAQVTETDDGTDLVTGDVIFPPQIAS